MSSLVVAMLLAFDLVFGLIPDQQELVAKLRGRIAENLAIQTAVLIEAGEPRALDRLYAELLARESGVLSVAVRRSDGRIVARAGDHDQWVAHERAVSSIDHVRVPLVMNKQQWGGVEVRFQRAAPANLLDWLQQPSVLVVAGLGVVSFFAFVFYLRRVLSYLDPSAVIPDRIRSAFDAFTSGVMIVDVSARVMLANSALRLWIGQDEGVEVTGRTVESLPVFRKALPVDRNEHSWVRAMRSGTHATGDHIELHSDDPAPVRLLVNSSPISDGTGRIRGCVVTFDNVTHLHELNDRLLQSMAEIARSKEEIEQKSEELRKLATRDPLTSCLNRRALMEMLDELFADARDKGRPLCCIMTDIDHFKAFNDRHGHAVGDEVLKAVSRVFSGALRDFDLLGRYGGEEFCIVLPDVTLEQACAVAERLRSEIEQSAGASVRTTRGLKITSSFGVSCYTAHIFDPAELIDLADKALYAAKKAGRNRVRRSGDEAKEAA
jgi:diguanylate cyclase (GGDEF)-like protein